MESGSTPDRPEVATSLRRWLVGIDHVGIAVPDLDAAITFYERMGLQVTHTETNSEQGVREAMLSVGSEGGAAIQLLAPETEESAIARFLERQGPGLQQLAFTVTDVEAAGQALREQGLRLLYEAARTGTAGSAINFVHPRDTGGVLIELVQPANTATGDLAHS